MNYETVRLKIRKYYIKATHKKRNKKIKNKDFTIISNNCWGGTVYQSYGLKYSTPTVGLYFMADDYIKFVYNIKDYLNYNLQFIKSSESKKTKLTGEKFNYPVGKLKDITEAVFNNLETDMRLTQIISYIPSMLKLNTETLRMEQLPRCFRSNK